jgi:hypothetical protein
MENEEKIDDPMVIIANLLNGQIRGSINAKAREENYELILMTLHKVNSEGFEDGFKIGQQVYIEKKAKEELAEQVAMEILSNQDTIKE